MRNNKILLLPMIVILLASLALSGCFGKKSTPNYELVVSTEGQGTVTPSGNYNYDKVTKVTLEATPAENWEFSHWLGEVADRDSARTEVIVDKSKSVTAVFVASLGKPVQIESDEPLTFKQGISLDISNINVPAGTSVTVDDVTDKIELPSELKTAGTAVEITFDRDLDFSSGVELRLPINGQVDQKRTGIFHKVGDQWEYMPTTIEDGFAKATATSFSTYAVLDADVVENPEIIIKDAHIHMSTKTQGAQIMYSITNPDYPGDDYELYAAPLEFDLFFECHAVATAPNKISSEVIYFKYVDPEYVVIKVVDEDGSAVSDAGVWFMDGTDMTLTDHRGLAVQKITAEETIIYSELQGYHLEPGGAIGKKGDIVTFVAYPSSQESRSKKELTFNPAAFRDPDKLNPFASPAIREAVNWLIDREHIAFSIQKSQSLPMYTFVDPNSFDYKFNEAVLAKLERVYAYDVAKAREVIDQEMRALGAVWENNQWYYGGEAVELIFIIRSDDERKQIGDYIAEQFNSIGFQVSKEYMTAEEASPIWLMSDPADGKWHLYTGAWNANVGIPAQFQDLVLWQLYTPHQMPQPLWQAYDPEPELLDAAGKLYYRHYSSLLERRALYEKGLKLSLKDSVRIWLTADIIF